MAPSKPKGKLFVIGGGPRPQALMDTLVATHGNDGYTLVFTQPSAEPDTSFLSVSKELEHRSDFPVIHVDSLKLNTLTVDSIKGASLIFITGGDQNRFLQRVAPTIREAIRAAYYDGATIAGTSAGAALMSALMITGDQVLEPEYEPTYSRLAAGNGIYVSGLALLDSALIDQHFVKRSRYNRIISALADTRYPYGIGIEESTALIVTPKGCEVSGLGQVLVFSRAQSYSTSNGVIGFRNMNLNAYLAGDTFQIK